MPAKPAVFNQCAGWAAAILALASLLAGVVTLGWSGSRWRKILGQIVVGSWVLGPPVFFWADWVYFTGGLTKDALDAVEHTHDLGRNIWLALVLLLVVLFDLKWPGSQ
jgi:hypothetical protein